MTHTVRDTAAILDAVHGLAPGDPYTAPAPCRPYVDELGRDPGRMRVGIMTSPPGGNFDAHPDCVAAANDAARLLQGLGHAVEQCYPSALDEGDQVAHFIVRWTSGVNAALKRWSAVIGRELGPEDLEPCTWALAQQAHAYRASDLLRAVEAQQAWARRIASWWSDEGFDLLLTPTCAEPPARLGEFKSTPEEPGAPLLRAIPTCTFAAPFNTTGQPAITLPFHWAQGLPIGVQLVAAYGREDQLIRVAAQIEQARPWTLNGNHELRAPLNGSELPVEEDARDAR